ncbi:tyrosine-type recombinase/integrase [Bradyrhizobium sp. 17]|uniref:integrase arm-type DNA-binding domain-containing protein n=1 Tax=Bradyrhizobium sp. 17 TaxID=2782649 RepID=UPI001FF8449E|nr:tyrosine-type recombinase/integrase [Bradyrhizobium sp. 17]MCK1523057.1 tyrosine-type recombinase/integrase [Bradyrhizobium sp. 17]
MMATRKLAVRKARKAPERAPRKLTDDHIEALREFADSDVADRRSHGVENERSEGVEYPDSIVKGLFVFVGANRTIWRFRRRRREKGVRTTIFRTLGEWPMMNTEDARKTAEIAVGNVHTGEAAPNKRSSIRFEIAFAAYLEYLKSKAEKRGKPPRWFYNVKMLGDGIILPKFAKWTLAEMAMSPGAVSSWHAEITKRNGPVSANHCARVIRATYKRASRLDVSLPQRLPTSAVEFNEESAKQDALPFKSFPAWLKAWRKVDNAIRQAYHLTALLVGPRPGELARLRWEAYSDNERTLIIAKAKAGKDIVIPVSEEIAAVLRMARKAAEALGYPVTPDALIFPGCAQAGHRDELPARGNMLRHTYSTVAADLGIDDLIRHFMMGHAPEGISQKYIATLILANGPKMREEQARMSRRIVELLGLNALTLKWEIAAGLAQSLSAAEVRADRDANALAKAQRLSARKRRGKVLGPRKKPAEITR